MPSPKSTCPICYNEYNQTTHTPRIIPSCGHSLCSKCLAGLISHSLVFHCPIDRTTYNLVSRNVSSFPINYALQDLINEDANYELCQHHEERMRLVCITDKCKVCDDCVLYGSHRGHEIKPLKKVQAETNKRIESLEGKLGEIKTWQKKFTDSLDDREKSFLEAVKKRFESLRVILKEKEEELHKEVQAFFAKEKKEVNSYLGEGSSVQKTLKHEITSLKESKDKNLAKVLQDGLPQNSLNFNTGFFQQRLQDLTQRLQEIEASIDQPLMTQVLLFKNFEVKIADKLDSSRGPQRSASDAFLKPSPMSIRPLNMPKALNMDKNDSFDVLAPIVSSARNMNMNNNNNENREGKGMNMKYKILRDTFLQNSPRNSARTRPRIVQRDVKNYEMVNKTTFQW